MVGVEAVIVSVRICVADEEALSVTRKVRVETPTVVGVPEMLTDGPLEELKFKPGGKLPVTDQL